MTKIVDLPGTPAPLGMTGEADWETLLGYTGEVTEEVVRSWWGDVPVSARPEVERSLEALEAEDPKLAALIRRVIKL
jgi:hypothetical protein